jgi:hypothetical protein
MMYQEPKGVDFYFDSTPLTEEQKKKISEVIAHNKRTGKKKRLVQHRIGAIHSGRRKARRSALA